MSSDMFETLCVIRGSLRYNAWLYNRIKRHLRGIIWDIGSGLGDIAMQFNEPCIEEVILSDYDPRMLNTLRHTLLPLKNYRVVPLDIADPQLPVSHPGGIADTITCINVLEHIEKDVTALKHMGHLLKKGGKAVIFVPALPGIFGTLDSSVGHYRRYTKKTLSVALKEAGFVVTDAYYMNMFGILTWFLTGRILKQKEFHKDACHMLDRIVPSLRALESWGSPPVGQSLIMVARIS
ncbi:MAG: class I SAM-dependent methyltransferase [Candidatus Omnitrophica bacterium]|nr:class I SAM-dependent methyltransferase [Candidatus Omnitrophota bacterium]